MAEPPRPPHDDLGPDVESATRLPGWVKVLAVAVIIVALLALAVMLVGGGGHSPRGH